MPYFGTVDSLGNTNFAISDDSTGWFNTFYDIVTFICPGVGPQIVTELSAWVAIFSGTPKIRLAIYNSLGALVGQGSGTVNVVGAGLSWQGHNQAGLTPNPIVLIGGQSYRFGIAREASGVLSTVIETGHTLGDVNYDPAVDLTGGWPATIPSETAYNSFLCSIRCFVKNMSKIKIMQETKNALLTQSGIYLLTE